MKKKFKLWLLKRKAYKFWKHKNIQCFIMPVENWKLGDYIIVHEKSRIAYNKQARKQGLKEFSRNEIIRNCVYCTPTERSFRTN
jgi:hypothetical protein